MQSKCFLDTFYSFFKPNSRKIYNFVYYFDDMSILRTENLMKKYGNRVVVQSVSFSVKQGEIVGLLGPNGAGKTTSFYMVMGLINPDGGRILLDDPIHYNAK